jgi:hypothetical protein
MLGIDVRTRSGFSQSYRLLPTMAQEQGFLLSPLIINNLVYSRFALPSWETDLADGTVSSFAIGVVDGSQSATFEPDFEVNLRRLDFERQAN